VIARSLLLIVASAIFWLLTALPARYFAGDWAVVQAGVAVLLCLVPAVATLCWSSWTFRSDPRQAALAALGSSGLRMFVVLLVALLLYTKVPPFQGEDGFLFWVAAAYLYTLAIEIVLLVRVSRDTRQHKSDCGA
jgi:hypothetical protein